MPNQQLISAWRGSAPGGDNSKPASVRTEKAAARLNGRKRPPTKMVSNNATRYQTQSSTPCAVCRSTTKPATVSTGMATAANFLTFISFMTCIILPFIGSLGSTYLGDIPPFFAGRLSILGHCHLWRIGHNGGAMTNKKGTCR